MTDSTPTPPSAEQPVTPPATAPAAAPPAYAAAPGVAAPKQTMSLVGFILGLAAFVFSWTGIIGVGAGIAAIIVSRRAKKSEPGAPSWMGLIALIAGIVGLVIGVIVGLVYVFGFIALAIAGSAYNSY